MPLDASWSRRHTPRSRGSDGTSHRASGTPSAAAPRRRPSAILRDAGQLPVPSSLPRPGSPGPPATSPCRDSLVSIADDPFFQRYGSALSPDGPLATPAPQTRPDHNLLGNWPPPRRESLAAGSAQHWSQTLPASPMESFNVAVIGAHGVDKSAFIQRALGLPRAPVAHTTSVRLVVDNVTHRLTLLELDLEHFQVSASRPIQWPKQIDGHMMPRVDAVLILYDVTSRASIRELPQTVAALTGSALPVALVACESDSPRDEWEINPESMAQHELFKPCIAAYQVSPETPEVARTCLQAILKAAIAHRKEDNVEGSSRRRAQSDATVDTADSANTWPVSDSGRHNRASSDIAAVRGLHNPIASETYRSGPPKSPHTGARTERQASDSLPEVDESDSESRRYSDEIPILQRGDDAIERQPKTAGISFDDLVDRFLAPRLTRADNNFSDVFMCLYRKFAAPGELFAAILARLDAVRDDKSAHYLTKTATQLRIIEVVAKWVSLYPGDFARAKTRKNLYDFIKHLLTEPIFTAAGQQICHTLRMNVTEDDDTGWANCDDAADQVASDILSNELKDLQPSLVALHFEEGKDDKPSSSHASQADRASSVGSLFYFNACDDYERQASLLEPTTHIPMCKVRYRIFMDIPDDDVAEALTRIDWIMFSSIRIRDFVRHVSLPAEQKDKCKSLKNVNRMIAHFNHIAQWVANMVLLRDKAKHRAQILEKFMLIALKLRQLNNYNGLAAVLAGINGTAIHRLALTRSLVPTEVQKRFARLVILMGTQKSHFAYRLAWENSPLPRIPFVPLHRRDLVSAEEGSKTFVGPQGDRVNWKKFEVLGEVLLPIMRSQGVAYRNLTRHEVAEELILNCRMPTDDEEIYQRSVQVENASTGSVDPSRKKFPWFAK